MSLLRAFLYASGTKDEWSVSPYREMAPLLEAVLGLATQGTTSALHVGFWRPDTARVAEIAKEFDGALLLSDAAIAALPPGALVSEAPVGRIEQLSFWLVLDGFGHRAAERTLQGAFSDPSSSSVTQFQKNERREGPRSTDSGERSRQDVDHARIPWGWVATLEAADAALFKTATDVGIFNEASYFEVEWSLPLEVRADLAVARYRCLSGVSPDPATLLDHLGSCPPWILSRDLRTFDLTVRARNVFSAHSLRTVADVLRLGINRLYKLPNFGRGTGYAFAQLLCDALQAGPTYSDQAVQSGSDSAQADAGTGAAQGEHARASLLEPPATPTTFLEGVEEAIGGLSDLQRDVLVSRIGYGTQPQTLQGVAERLGVTRERVRQIQKKSFGLLAPHPVWAVLSSKLDLLLRERTTPLLVQGMSVLDLWFVGVEGHVKPLEELCERLLGDRFHIIFINDVPVVTRLSGAGWEKAKRSCRAMLEESMNTCLDEAQARALVDTALVQVGSELRDDLWAAVTEDALWVSSGNGCRVLSGFSRSAESVVTAILMACDEPLHFSEIARRAAFMGEQCNPRSLHNAAAVVGHLFGRGIYGLRRHSSLSDEQLALVRQEIEALILGGVHERQWHADELADELVVRGLDFDGQVSKYIVNLALAESEALSYLGRMVWGLKKQWAQEAASRLDMRQAVIATLEAAGTPLSTTEIKRRIQDGRGVNEHFQIFPSGPLIRLGPALWGLSPRDVPHDLEPTLDAIRVRLHAHGRGLHVAEIEEMLTADMRPLTLDTRALIGFGFSRGLRIDRGAYVYLVEWRESRRLSVSDALKRVLEEFDVDGATIETIHSKVNVLTERGVPRTHISTLLQDCDVEWDAASGRWKMANRAASADDSHRDVSDNVVID